MSLPSEVVTLNVPVDGLPSAATVAAAGAAAASVAASVGAASCFEQAAKVASAATSTIFFIFDFPSSVRTTEIPANTTRDPGGHLCLRERGVESPGQSHLLSRYHL